MSLKEANKIVLDNSQSAYSTEGSVFPLHHPYNHFCINRSASLVCTERRVKQEIADGKTLKCVRRLPGSSCHLDSSRSGDDIVSTKSNRFHHDVLWHQRLSDHDCSLCDKDSAVTVRDARNRLGCDLLSDEASSDHRENLALSSISNTKKIASMLPCFTSSRIDPSQNCAWVSADDFRVITKHKNFFEGSGFVIKSKPIKTNLMRKKRTKKSKQTAQSKQILCRDSTSDKSSTKTQIEKLDVAKNVDIFHNDASSCSSNVNISNGKVIRSGYRNSKKLSSSNTLSKDMKILCIQSERNNKQKPANRTLLAKKTNRLGNELVERRLFNNAVSVQQTHVTLSCFSDISTCPSNVILSTTSCSSSSTFKGRSSLSSSDSMVNETNKRCVSKNNDILPETSPVHLIRRVSVAEREMFENKDINTCSLSLSIAGSTIFSTSASDPRNCNYHDSESTNNDAITVSEYDGSIQNTLSTLQYICTKPLVEKDKFQMTLNTAKTDTTISVTADCDQIANIDDEIENSVIPDLSTKALLESDKLQHTPFITVTTSINVSQDIFKVSSCDSINGIIINCQRDANDEHRRSQNYVVNSPHMTCDGNTSMEEHRRSQNYVVNSPHMTCDGNTSMEEHRRSQNYVVNSPHMTCDGNTSIEENMNKRTIAHYKIRDMETSGSSKGFGICANASKMRQCDNFVDKSSNDVDYYMSMTAPLGLFQNELAHHYSCPTSPTSSFSSLFSSPSPSPSHTSSRPTSSVIDESLSVNTTLDFSISKSTAEKTEEMSEVLAVVNRNALEDQIEIMEAVTDRLPAKEARSVVQIIPDSTNDTGVAPSGINHSPSSVAFPCVTPANFTNKDDCSSPCSSDVQNKSKNGITFMTRVDVGRILDSTVSTNLNSSTIDVSVLDVNNVDNKLLSLVSQSPGNKTDKANATVRVPSTASIAVTAPVQVSCFTRTLCTSARHSGQYNVLEIDSSDVKEHTSDIGAPMNKETTSKPDNSQLTCINSANKKQTCTGCETVINPTVIPPISLASGGNTQFTWDLRMNHLTTNCIGPSTGSQLTAFGSDYINHGVPPLSNQVNPCSTQDVAHHTAFLPVGSTSPSAKFTLAYCSTGQVVMIPTSESIEQTTLLSAFTGTVFPSQAFSTALTPVLVLPVYENTFNQNLTLPLTISTIENDSAITRQNMVQRQKMRSQDKDPRINLQYQTAFSANNVIAYNTYHDISINQKTTDSAKQTAILLTGPGETTSASAIYTTQTPLFVNTEMLSQTPVTMTTEAAQLSDITTLLKVVKVEQPKFQSRGCSPIVCNSSSSGVIGEFDSSVSHSLAVNVTQVSSASVSVQTGEKTESCLETMITSNDQIFLHRHQGTQTNLSDQMQPLSVICCSSDIYAANASQSMYWENSSPSTALATAAAILDTDSCGATKKNVNDELNAQPDITFDPFTDPQILQAASGLELLSTLADRRPKHDFLPLADLKTVFPSPSESFKSDATLPSLEIDDPSSCVDIDMKESTSHSLENTQAGHRSCTFPCFTHGPSSSSCSENNHGSCDILLYGSSSECLDHVEVNQQPILTEQRYQHLKRKHQLAKPKSTNSHAGSTSCEVDSTSKRRRTAKELVDKIFRKFSTKKSLRHRTAHDPPSPCTSELRQPLSSSNSDRNCSDVCHPNNYFLKRRHDRLMQEEMNVTDKISEGSSARKKEFLSTTGISHSNGAVSDMAIVTTIDIQSMSHSGAISNNFVHCCIDSASRPSTSSTPTCVSSSGERPAKASNIAIVPDEMWRAQKSENSSSVCHGSGKLYDNMILNNDDEISLPSSSPDGQFSNRNFPCRIAENELKDGLQVLYFRDNLLYDGVVREIEPPDIYGVMVTGQRGTRPDICSREDALKNAIKPVEPGSLQAVPLGTRVCAYWSDHFRCLYPGTVSDSEVTNVREHRAAVRVVFDDGDTGYIPLRHIRLLPDDFPIAGEPIFDPFLGLSKRWPQQLEDLGLPVHQKTRCKDGKGNICCSERSIDDQRKECQQRSGTVQSSSQPAEEFSARGIGVTDKPSTMIGLDSERECSVCEFSKVKSRKRSNIDSKVDQLVSTSNIFFSNVHQTGKPYRSGRDRFSE